MQRNIKTHLSLYIAISLFFLCPFFDIQTTEASAITAQKVIELVNTSRLDNNLNILSENAHLKAAAENKAQDMFEHSYFLHTSPEGKTPWYWIEKNNYTYIHAGENLAIHFSNAENEHQAWMSSPSHRKNILQSSYTEIGVAVKKGNWKGTPTTIVVQIFGTPSRAPFAFSEHFTEPPKLDTAPVNTLPATSPEVRTALLDETPNVLALENKKIGNELFVLQVAHFTLLSVLFGICTFNVFCIAFIPAKSIWRRAL